MNASELQFEFEHESRGWTIEAKPGSVQMGPWQITINGVHQSAMEVAPRNERALSETHKSKTHP